MKDKVKLKNLDSVSNQIDKSIDMKCSISMDESQNVSNTSNSDWFVSNCMNNNEIGVVFCSAFGHLDKQLMEAECSDLVE